MTTTIPSFEEYRDARYILDHPLEFADGDVPGARQTIAEFETAVRDAVAARFADRTLMDGFVPGLAAFELMGWDDMPPGMQDVLFDAAMVGARTAQGGVL